MDGHSAWLVCLLASPVPAGFACLHLSASKGAGSMAFLLVGSAVPCNLPFKLCPAEPRAALPNSGLQSLGMSSEQMYKCLMADTSYCSPTALPRLSECL